MPTSIRKVIEDKKENQALDNDLQRALDYQKARKVEELNRKHEYSFHLENQMKQKRDNINFIRDEKERLRSQIKSRAEQVRSQEH